MEAFYFRNSLIRDFLHNFLTLNSIAQLSKHSDNK